MKITTTLTTLFFIAMTLLISTAVAVAHDWHRGGDSGFMMGPGYGSNRMGVGQGYDSSLPGYPAGNDLSARPAADLDAAQEAFLRQTYERRDEIHDKGIALHQELTRRHPDTVKMIRLQKRISAMQSEFDQKALQQRLEVHTIVPRQFR